MKVYDDELFFDYKFYNVDTFNVPDTQNLLVEIYFRLEVDEISHTRIVFTIMDWLGALGGVPDLLFQLAGFIIGGYAAFNSSFFTISGLYRVRSEDTLYLESSKNDPLKPHE